MEIPPSFEQLMNFHDNRRDSQHKKQVTTEGKLKRVRKARDKERKELENDIKGRKKKKAYCPGMGLENDEDVKVSAREERQLEKRKNDIDVKEDNKGKKKCSYMPICNGIGHSAASAKSCLFYCRKKKKDDPVYYAKVERLRNYAKVLIKQHTNSGEEGGIVKLPREDWIVDVLGEEGSFYMDDSEMQI